VADDEDCGAGGELEEGREEAVCFDLVLGKLISLKYCNIYILYIYLYSSPYT